MLHLINATLRDARLQRGGGFRVKPTVQTTLVEVDGKIRLLPHTNLFKMGNVQKHASLQFLPRCMDKKGETRRSPIKHNPVIPAQAGISADSRTAMRFPPARE